MESIFYQPTEGLLHSRWKRKMGENGIETSPPETEDDDDDDLMC